MNEKSDGRLSVKVFPAGQLGADEDVIEQAIQGVNVAVNTDAARMGQYVKDFSIFMMAYFVDNYDEGYAVTQTETFKNWEKELKKTWYQDLSFSFMRARHFMTTNQQHSR